MQIPRAITDEPLWTMEVYRLALFLGDLAWYDACTLIKHPITVKLAGQLYNATGGISACISEGFSRASLKDQARFYEYALGSARESRDWYFKARYVVGENVAEHRLRLLAEISRHLMKIIPTVRGQKVLKKGIQEARVEYVTETSQIDLFDAPMPEYEENATGYTQHAI